MGSQTSATNTNAKAPGGRLEPSPVEKNTGKQEAE